MIPARRNGRRGKPLMVIVTRGRGRIDTLCQMLCRFRPDWRAMLAGMSSTEYADWHRFYSTHYFHDVLLDMHFSGLTYTVLSLFFSDPEMHPLDFSLLNRREADEEPEDDVLPSAEDFRGRT